MHVLKVGGNELNDKTFLTDLAAAVASMSEPVVIVHGGGQAIADMQARLGLQTVKVDGLRVTDAESLDVIQMVLSGHANKAITAALLAAGLDAIGLSGVDGSLLRCEKKQHPKVDLGYVGQIVAVRSELLLDLLARKVIPVVSPVSLGQDGQIYNVNADEAAAAIGAALQANVVSFVSNVPAVLDGDDRPISALTTPQTQQLIASGVIRDGMVPKVQAALNVVDLGVATARIVNLAGLANGGGTHFRL